MRAYSDVGFVCDLGIEAFLRRVICCRFSLSACDRHYLRIRHSSLNWRLVATVFWDECLLRIFFSNDNDINNTLCKGMRSEFRLIFLAQFTFVLYVFIDA